LDPALLAFVVLVAIGGYVQTVAGFAMGMIILTGATALGLYALPVIAAVVSLVSLLNIAFSLHGHYHRIHRAGLRWLLVGQVPAIALGVVLLGFLDANAERVLRGLLGAFIVLGCGAMMLRPTPRGVLSTSPAFLGAGLAGGLLAGLFAASGPVLGWFLYRQPLQVAEIRATLLATFAFSTLLRTLVVGAEGGLTTQVWTLAGFSVGAVLFSVWLARRFPPPIPEAALRRTAFALLTLMGLSILAGALAPSLF
jgi:uncharacterized membrane protein YfcA